MKSIFLGTVFLGLAAAGFATVVTLHQVQSVQLQNKQQVVELDNTPTSPPVLKKHAPEAIEPIADAPTVDTTAALDTPPPLPDEFSPFGANIGGSFDLIDHFGEARQLEDYRGKHVMIFFGYANCLAICSAALPLMADTIDLLGEAGEKQIVPLMITVDPENDTPDFMREKLAEYHPRLIGMTGSEGQLADVRSKFQIRIEYIGEDIEGNPIYNHGSFIYLMGPDGEFQTLLPPVMGPSEMAQIIKKYLGNAEG